MPESIKDVAFTLLGLGVTPLAMVLGWLSLRLWKAGTTWSSKWRTLGRAISIAVGLVALAGFVLGVFGLWVRFRPQPSEVQRVLHPGIEYRRTARQQPRPVVIHIVEVDLRADLELVPSDNAVRGCLPAATTSSFLEAQRVQLAINTQFFFPCPGFDHPEQLVEGQPLRPVGRYAVDGELVVGRKWLGNTIYIGEDGAVSVGDRPEVVHHAISGRHRLVRNGQAATTTDDLIAPRLAVGFDKERTTMTVVLVDGRQRGYSEGLTLPELAELLVELGIEDAIELDGGGSATIVTEDEDGDAEVLNSPIHRRLPGNERPVANHLGVRVGASR